MKSIQTPARVLAAILATGMMMAASQVRAENVPQVIQVIRVEGRAKWSTDSRNWVDLKAGDTLKPGAVIMTADRSLVDVVLGDRDSVGNIPMTMTSAGSASGGSGGGGGGGSEDAGGNVIRVFASTVVGVDKLILDRTGMDEVSETQLDLRAGQIFVNVKKLSKQSRYEIKIPNGVAGIRGSGVFVSSVGIIKTVTGSTIAAIIRADGSTLTKEVPAGHSFDPGTGVVSEMSPEELNRLQQILDELSPFIQRIAEFLKKDHTIFHCSNLDGTPTGH